MSALGKPAPVSVEDYLAGELDSQVKHEGGRALKADAAPSFSQGVRIAALLLIPSALGARDLRVGLDPEFPTIAAAIRVAEAGDTIHLEPGKVYREVAAFSGKKGEPGNPIVLEGHGAVLDGSDPIDPAAWTEVSPGLFANDHLLPRLTDAVLSRWFFLWNGEVVRMDRASKGHREPFKDPEDLVAGEWTFVAAPAPEEAGSRDVSGTFYLKLPAGRSLADESLYAPVRSNGVQLSGENAHLVIRNVTARHPWNDGFNIHGHCHDVVFENIAAFGCGDDGISAHGTAQYRVRGLVSIGNSTGICDINSSVTDYEDVFIADCVSYDLFFLDQGRHSITNAVVLSAAQNPFTLTGRSEGDCRLRMENVLFRRLAEPRLGQVAERATLDAERCTFEGIDIRETGTARWSDSLVDGAPSEAGASGADTAGLQRLIPESYRGD